MWFDNYTYGYKCEMRKYTYIHAKLWHRRLCEKELHTEICLNLWMTIYGEINFIEVDKYGRLCEWVVLIPKSVWFGWFNMEIRVSQVWVYIQISVTVLIKTRRWSNVSIILVILHCKLQTALKNNLSGVFNLQVWFFTCLNL